MNVISQPFHNQIVKSCCIKKKKKERKKNKKKTCVSHEMSPSGSSSHNHVEALCRLTRTMFGQRQDVTEQCLLGCIYRCSELQLVF